MKESFDLIFGIGENCNTSLMLRRYNLQTASFPFDWLDNSHFKKNLSILCSEFNGFTDKNDLKLVENSNNGVCERYYNTKNELYFVHDFPIKKDFESQYPIVEEKYHKRGERLIKRISSGKKCLIVFMTKNSDSIDKIISEVEFERENLKEKFPKTQISFLYIINSSDGKYTYNDKKLNLKIVSDDFDIERKTLNIVFLKINYKKDKYSSILKDYKLKMTMREKFSSFVYKIKKFYIALIPSKTLQMKIRHKNKYN